jgi:hypothetical protein
MAKKSLPSWRRREMPTANGGSDRCYMWWDGSWRIRSKKEEDIFFIPIGFPWSLCSIGIIEHSLNQFNPVFKSQGTQDFCFSANKTLTTNHYFSLMKHGVESLSLHYLDHR